MSLQHTPLNDAQLRVLKLLAAGGRIEARRRYPSPAKYWLMKPNGFRYATGLSIDLVSSLLREKLIESIAALRQDEDRFDYTITDRGRQAASDGAVIYDDEQSSMFGSAA